MRPGGSCIAKASRTFRIFVSSTFSDLKQERDALQREVFPRLRELCLQHGARFQAIDLRWGVSEEAALDQSTMMICLEEIRRCQRTTPRPNFIVLLGDRYGWRPLPPRILAAEFDGICQRIAKEEVDGLRAWYRRDDNAVPADYVLQPRQGEHEDFDRWTVIEERLRAILVKAVEGMPLEAYDRLKYVASATEQEIAAGALRVEDAETHVSCFFRRIVGLPHDPRARDFVDMDEHGYWDAEARERLDNLKYRLRGLLPSTVHDYEARWTGDGVTTDHIPQLCADVYESLARVIVEEVSELEQVPTLDREIADHEAFGAERAARFIGRTSILGAIGSYIQGADRPPLAVFGASGSGKSAVMARAFQQARAGHPDAAVLVRFIGATPDSSDSRALLASLCHQISRRYGADETSIPADYEGLVQEFPKRLDLATAEVPLILFLDALDQLTDVAPGGAPAWLPAQLPDHVHLVVSTLPDLVSALSRMLPPTGLVELLAMPLAEGRVLLDLWLDDADRTLQAQQRDEVLAKFDRNGLPLYLKLAFEEARRWASYDPVPSLSPDIPGIIRDLFARLSQPENHGPVLVSRSLGSIEASKNGLSEDELLDVLSTAPEVLADFLRRSPRSPVVERLPVVIWSRLYFDLEPYLTERSADGASLFGFYHRQLGEVVAQEYLADEAGLERHRTLARYFGAQPLEITRDGISAPNLRKLAELPYQQTMGELWDDLFATLTNFQFLERKAATGVVERTGFDRYTGAPGVVTRTYTGVFQLQDDFELALQRWPA